MVSEMYVNIRLHMVKKNENKNEVSLVRIIEKSRVRQEPNGQKKHKITSIEKQIEEN